MNITKGDGLVTYEEVMSYLEEVGTGQTQKTYKNHGATGVFYGVKIADMKKIMKHVKKDQELVLKFMIQVYQMRCI